MIEVVCEAGFYEIWYGNFSKYCSNAEGRCEYSCLPSSRSDSIFKKIAFEESVSEFKFKIFNTIFKQITRTSFKFLLSLFSC